MIDHEERQQIEQRAKGARRAVETVQVHTDGGLFGEIPLSVAAQLFPAAVSSARDVPRLLKELDRLAPASYVLGPEQCCDGDCDDKDPMSGLRCTHLREAVATFDDVKRAEYLGRLVGSIRERLVDDENTDELVADIDTALEAMEAAESAGWAH